MVVNKTAFRDACISMGAHRVSAKALTAFDAAITQEMVDIAKATVANTKAAGRVTVEAADLEL